MQNKHWTTANELVKARDWHAALTAFNEAFKSLADEPDLVHDRAVCLFQVGRKKEALEELNRAVLLQPDYSYRYASRAYIRNAMKDIHGAIDDYKMAIELDPEDAISHNNLGMLEEQLGYRSEADERYRLADELNQMLKERGIDPNSPTENSVNTGEPHADHPHASEEPVQPSSLKQEISKVITSRDGFRDFIRFIRNGLKLGSQKSDQRDQLP